LGVVAVYGVGLEGNPQANGLEPLASKGGRLNYCGWTADDRVLLAAIPTGESGRWRYEATTQLGRGYPTLGWCQCGPILPPGPIIPCIIARIPSFTNPVTSRACARIVSVRAGSSAVSSAITPVAVKVSWRR
jgi:hypothetical protein